MRSLARLSPALLGLVLAVPTTGQAGPPDTSAPQKHHRGLFRACMCTDCQRARVKAKDGVDVPLPPPIPANIVSVGNDRGMPGQVARHAHGGKTEECAVCQEGTIVSGPVMMAGDAPGHAVVGGAAPGYAVVGDSYPMAEPSPIGTMQGPGANRMAPGMAARGAKRDPSVAATEFASPTPVPGTGHNHPHIIKHLFGLDAIGKRSAQERERREREKHAMIPYGPQQAQVITDLPANIVYKGGH